MIKRRTFIAGAGLAAVGATAYFADPFIRRFLGLTGKAPDPKYPEGLTDHLPFSCELTRAQDSLHLRFYFINLEPIEDRLEKIDRDKDAFIVVRLRQQHIGEEVKHWPFDLDCSVHFPADPAEISSKSFISGFSYLTFRLRGKKTWWIEFTRQALLDWNQYDLVTLRDLQENPAIPVKLIAPDNYPLSNEKVPAALVIAEFQNQFVPVTIIEAPYKIFLVPRHLDKESESRYQFVRDQSDEKIGYFSSDASGRVLTLSEWWNNDLVYQSIDPKNGPSTSPPHFKIVAYEENSDGTRPDAGVSLLPDPVRSDRSNLAKLTNLGTDDETRDVTSEFFNVAALGVSTKLHYENEVPQEFRIVKWSQDIMFGRDNKVVITDRAMEMRSGIKVTKTRISERRIERGKSFLIYRQRFDYPLTKPAIKFDPPQLFQGHLIREITPLLKGAYYTDGARQGDVGNIALEECGPPGLLKMPYECVDAAGTTFTMYMDVYLITEGDFANEVGVKKTLRAFDSYLTTAYAGAFDHSIRLDKVKVGYCKSPQEAEDLANQPDATHLVTEELQFFSVYGGTFDSTYPILPRLKYAKVYIPQLEGIESIPKAHFVNYCKTYVNQGLEAANKTKVFLQTLKDDFPTKFSIQTDDDASIIDSIKQSFRKAIKDVFTDNYRNAGGLMNPDIVIENISVLKQGITLTDELNDRISDMTTISPSDILRGINTEILGGIDLKQIILNVIPIAESPLFEIIEERNEAFRKITTDSNYVRWKALVEQLPKQIAKVEELLKSELPLDEMVGKLKSFVDQYFEISAKLNHADLRSTIQIKYNGLTRDLVEVVRDWEGQLGKAVDVLGLPPALQNEAAKIRTFLDKQVTNPVNEIYQGSNIQALLFFKQLIEAVESEDPAVAVELKRQFKQYIVNHDLETTATKKIRSAYVANLSGISFNSLPPASLIALKEVMRKRISELQTDVASLDQNFRAMLTPALMKTLGFDPKNNGSIILKDNLYGWFDFLDQNVKSLRSASSGTYQLFYETYTELTADSKTVLQKEAAKLTAYSKKFVEQISDALNQELQKYNADIDLLKAYYLIRDTYFYFQNIYLEFAAMRKKAEEIEASKLVALSPYIAALKAWQEGELESELRVALGTKLDKIKQEARQEIKEKVDVAAQIIKDRLGELKFGELDTYAAKFQDAETLIAAHATDLYLKVDQKRQQLLENIQRLRGELEDAKLNLRNCLSDKLKEIKNELEVKNSALINAYRERADEVDTIRGEIDTLRRTLSELTAINRREVRYTWTTEKFQDVNLGVLTFIRGRQAPTRLTVDVRNAVNFDIQKYPPTITGVESIASSKLSNFSISFLNLITLDFDSISFIGGSSVKEKFDVAIRDVHFEGPLNFVQVFQRYLKTLDKGLNIDISAAGAKLGYEMGLPSINGGAFNFTKAKLQMDLRLPFKAGVPMRFDFGLNNPSDMFLVTAGIFGGRGCFMIGVEPKRGVVMILLVIEFGAVLYLNIGIAEGIVYLFAGIYIKKEYDNIEFRGYLTCGGALSILGIITISVTFYLGLRGGGTYLEGYCTLSIEIKICAFITISVGLSVYKRIYGSPDNTKRSEVQREQTFTIKAPTVPEAEPGDVKSNVIKLTGWDEYFNASYL
jgi:hypothetical protein